MNQNEVWRVYIQELTIPNSLTDIHYTMNADLEFTSRFNQTLAELNHTLVCAESITAGLLASTIASVPGTTAVLKGSIVSYDRAVKEHVLGVPRSIIDRYTAESQETTHAMLRGVRALFPNASIHVAVTGVATVPPVDFDPFKVAGQTYLALCVDGELFTYNTVIRPQSPDDLGNQCRQAVVRYILERILERIGSPEGLTITETSSLR